MEVSSFLAANDWHAVHTFDLPERPGAYEAVDDLPLKAPARQYLAHFKGGIYAHQHEAILRFQSGSDVCLSTSTASGKSLVFYACGIEQIVSDPNARILAIYPLKALGTEQEVRWQEALNRAGLRSRVGRIDGSVPVAGRASILKECQVVIMTPDVIHAWLLSNLSQRAVQRFLSELRIVVLDEAHTYAGVFGSNAAFLLRRLCHVADLLGAKPKFIAASATIRSPEQHLEKLTGRQFHIIDREADTSAKRESRIILAEPPPGADLITSLSELMAYVANNTDHRFITFVDSRKQTEQLAAVMQRTVETDDDAEELEYGELESLRVYPYRAGYEEDDRRRIQEKLTRGELKGVVSTSALEMGVDIPSLSLAILYGIPGSATSFFQRIGRVGRHQPGTIIVVNNGSVLSKSVFRKPEELLNMPLAESALYLDNPRIQYIHALCLARSGGEHDTVSTVVNRNSDHFNTDAIFPENFVELCRAEQIGEISSEFQSMKSQAGDNPNYAFPLRDNETQYQVEFRRGPVQMRLGSLSFGQLMREAYPGGVYYYQTQPYRVTKINTRSRIVEVRREAKRYTTKPNFLPTLIFPNLTEGNVYSAIRHGDLTIVECNQQVREAICGFTERRGPNQFAVNYPLNATDGLYFDQQRFTRNYFTSGVLFNHPALNGERVSRSTLAEILFESFLIVVPFERQDVNYGDDKHRADRGTFHENDRFISIFDQAYGSLRLTNRLMNEDVLRRLFQKATDIAANDEAFEINAETRSALLAMASCARKEQSVVNLTTLEDSPGANLERIILPGSVGLNVNRENEEFFVESVFFSPKGLQYKGKHISQQTQRFDGTIVTVPIKNLVEVPGESKTGYYNLETGEIE